MDPANTLATGAATATDNRTTTALNWVNLSIIAVVANFGPFLFGYEVGAMTWVILCFQDVAGADDDKYAYYQFVANSSAMVGFVAGAAALGATLAYPFLLYCANALSKKDEIMLASLLYFAGGLAVSISGQLNWSYPIGLIFFLIGQLIIGAGIAAALHAIPQYISEVTPTEARGKVGAVTESVVMTGMCLGFGIAYLFESFERSWVVTFAIFYLLAIVMGVFTLLLPNSPTWMLQNDYSTESVLEEIRYVFPQAEIDHVQHIQENVQNEKNLTIVRLDECRTKNEKLTMQDRGCLRWSGLYDLLTPELQVIANDLTLSRCVSVVMAISAFKIAVGQVFIMYYAAYLFTALFHSKEEEMIVVYMLSRLVTAFTMIYFADMVGRRIYMIGSVIFMTLGMLLCCLGFELSATSTAAVGLFFAGIGFEVGFGSVSYFLIPELTPFFIRSTANALSNFVLFLCFFIVNFVGTTLLKTLGVGGIMLLFTCANMVCAVYFYFYLPETKGLDIELSYTTVDATFDNAPHMIFCRDERTNTESRMSYSNGSENTAAVHVPTGPTTTAGGMSRLNSEPSETDSLLHRHRT